MHSSTKTFIVVCSFATFAVGADGGGCGNKAPDVMSAMDALPFCPLFASVNASADAMGSVYFCNVNPSAVPPTILTRIADALPSWPCGVPYCARDLDGAYGQADTMLGVNAVTGAAEGLRCILGGTTLGEAKTFVPPMIWLATCVSKIMPAPDAGAPVMCQDLGDPCDKTGGALTCCSDMLAPEGMICDNENGVRNPPPDAVGKCCIDAPFGCLLDSDCCRGSCDAQMVNGSPLYFCTCSTNTPGNDGCSSDQDCCVGLHCVEEGMSPRGRACR